MSERTTGRGRTVGAVVLAIAGILVLLYGAGLLTFSCFMVTDPVCQSEATGKAAPVVLVGICLLAAAVWVGTHHRRGGDREGRPRP
jgi:hypothetical protein